MLAVCAAGWDGGAARQSPLAPAPPAALPPLAACCPRCCPQDADLPDEACTPLWPNYAPDLSDASLLTNGINPDPLAADPKMVFEVRCQPEGVLQLLGAAVR